MSQGICQDSMSRYYDADIMQDSVPDSLIGPKLNFIKSSESSRPHSGNVRQNHIVLLEAQVDCRSQEPDQLDKLAVVMADIRTKPAFSGGHLSSSTMIRRIALQR